MFCNTRLVTATVARADARKRPVQVWSLTSSIGIAWNPLVVRILRVYPRPAGSEAPGGPHADRHAKLEAPAQTSTADSGAGAWTSPGQGETDRGPSPHRASRLQHQESSPGFLFIQARRVVWDVWRDDQGLRSGPSSMAFCPPIS